MQLLLTDHVEIKTSLDLYAPQKVYIIKTLFMLCVHATIAVAIASNTIHIVDI